MIKLAFCIDTLEVGGTELNAVRTAERLDRSRFDLSVLHLQPDGPLLERYRSAGIPLHHFPIASLYGTGTIARGIQLRSYLRRQGIQILHAHDLYTNIFSVPWARLAGVPAVIASRRWWKATPRRGQLAINRFAYRFAHRVLANSASVARLLETEEGLSPDKVQIIPNFVGEGAFNALPSEARRVELAKIGVPFGVIVLGIVARLAPVKDHATLLRAAGILAQRGVGFHLVIVGDGNLRASLEALARDLHLFHWVSFAGALPNEPNPHQLFDISVLSSVSEGFPNSVVEGMAAGRPVVASAVGGTVDAVVPEQTGILVPPEDPGAMAHALERLVRDVELRGRMGAAATARARLLYHETSVIEMLSSWYESLILRPGSGSN